MSCDEIIGFSWPFGFSVTSNVGVDQMVHKLFIVGTGHSFQCGCKPYTQSDIDNFRSFIRDLCQRENIRFIAEEMSSDGLKEHSAQSTIFFSLKSEPALNLDLAYVDLDRTMRAKLGIDSCGLRKAAVRSGQMTPDKKLEELYSVNLDHVIRECSWLAQILSRNLWPTLLICGANHVKGIVSRALSVAIQTVVVNEDYKP